MRVFFGFLILTCLSLVAVPAPAAAPGAPPRENTLIVAVEGVDFAPYHYLRDGRLTGISADTVRAVAGQLGYAVEFRSYPWARVVESFEQQRGDAVMDLLHKPEREAFLHYPAENLDWEETVLFTTRESPLGFDGDLSTLAGRAVGVVRGYWYGTEFKEATGFDRIELNSQETLVRNVGEGRIEVAIGTKAAIDFEARAQGLRDRIRFLEPPVNRLRNYIAFIKHPGRATLAKRFSEALAAFKKSEAYSAIVRRHLGDGAPPR